MTRLSERPAAALISAIAAGQVSAVDLLDSCLETIAERNPALNAIVTLDADGARKAAVAADTAVRSGASPGPLHGIPIVVKDVTETAGLRTTYGSPLYADHVPAEDAEVVARLRRAGAIILGKTNAPEFATGASTFNAVFGVTRNPWNPALSPAGSSGGSAAAVAAGMVPLAHGTDFGCSIRIPAAFCGLVGVRPTGGLVPNRPLPLSPDYGQVHGPLGRTAEDAALFLDAIAGLDPLWPGSVAPPWRSAREAMDEGNAAAPARVAYVEDMAGIGVDPAVVTIMGEALGALDGAGFQVERMDFDASEGIAAYDTLRAAWMVGQQFGRLDRLDAFGPALSGNVRRGLAVDALALAAAAHVRDRLFERFRALLLRYDAIVTPAAPILPFPAEQAFPDEVNGRKLANYIDWIAPAFLVTLVGLPAVSVPAGLSADGLPVGMQIIGRRFDEPRLLAMARHVQALRPIGSPPGVGAPS
jgi:amidase